MSHLAELEVEMVLRPVRKLYCSMVGAGGGRETVDVLGGGLGEGTPLPVFGCVEEILEDFEDSVGSEPVLVGAEPIFERGGFKGFVGESIKHHF